MKLNKELEALDYIMEIYDKFDSTRDEEYNLIKQALTSPTSDEIIKELDKYYDDDFILNPATCNFENVNSFANDIRKGTHRFIGAIDSSIGKRIIGLEALPLKLAHKITSFFINKEE